MKKFTVVMDDEVYDAFAAGCGTLAPETALVTAVYSVAKRGPLGKYLNVDDPDEGLFKCGCRFHDGTNEDIPAKKFVE